VYNILRGKSLNQLLKELEIGMGGLQGMLYNFHKLKGPPHKVVDDGYYQDSMNSVLQTLLSAVKMCTTCRHGHYLCREEVKKGSMPYDAWCNL
jgi:hypothetical protein